MTDHTPAHEFAHLVEGAYGAISVPLRTALVADSYRNFEDTQDLVREFAGKHWRDLAPERLHYHRAGLKGLSATGFQFYLPAYLRSAFPHAQSPWWYSDDILEWTLWALAAQSSTEGEREKFQLRISLLTAQQREVVRTFLRYLQIVGASPDSLLGVHRRGGWDVEG